MSETTQRWAFGDFVYDTERGELLRADERVDLQPQVFTALKHFLDHAGVLLTREALHEALWPGIFVAEDALSQLVRKLRVALGDRPRSPKYLETVPRRGYRFIAEVTPLESTALERSEAAQVAPVLVVASDLYGRERELAQVLEAITQGAWVVQLAGLGGIGKSHLAAACVRELSPRFEATTTVDLQETSSLAGMLRAVAHALEVRLEEGAEDHVAHLGRALSHRGRVLVLLDDLDELEAAVCAPLMRWRHDAPEVTWLLTGRRRLELSQVYLINLGPLPREGARALFRQRAAALGGGEVLEGDGELDPLLDRLDDSPLAIELAAARTRVLGLPQIRARLEDRFRLLRDRSHDRPVRHRSVHACVLGTWERLEPELQQALALLAAFPGAFDPSTAEALLEGACDDDPLDLLDDLHGHALLHRQVVEGRSSLRLLETVRAFVRQRPEAEGALAAGRTGLTPVLLERWLQLSAAAPMSAERLRVAALLVEQLDVLVDGPAIVEVLRQLIRWILERGPMDVAQRAVRRAADSELTPEDEARLAMVRLELTPSWSALRAERLGATREQLEVLGRSDLSLELEVLDSARGTRAWGDRDRGAITGAWVEAARTAKRQDVRTAAVRVRADYLMDSLRAADALELLDSALLEAAGEDRAELLDSRSRAMALQGRSQEGITCGREAVDLFRRLGWRRRGAYALANMAGKIVLVETGSPVRAMLREASGVLASIGERRGEAMVLANLAVQELFDGDGASALDSLRRADELAIAENLARIRAVIAHNFASARWLLGEEQVALAECERGLGLAQETGFLRQEGLLQAWCAGLQAALGRGEAAERSLARATELIAPADEGAAEVLLWMTAHVHPERREALGEASSPRARLMDQLLQRRFTDTARSSRRATGPLAG